MLDGGAEWFPPPISDDGSPIGVSGEAPRSYFGAGGVEVKGRSARIRQSHSPQEGEQQQQRIGDEGEEVILR